MSIMYGSLADGARLLFEFDEQPDDDELDADEFEDGGSMQSMSKR